MASSLSNTCPVCSSSIVLPKPIRMTIRRIEAEMVKRSKQDEELGESKKDCVDASILSVLMEEMTTIVADSHHLEHSKRELYDTLNYALHDRAALIAGEFLTYGGDCKECGQPRLTDGWLRTVFRLCLTNILDDIHELNEEISSEPSLRDQCIIGLQHACLLAVLSSARGIGKNKITEEKAEKLASEIAEFTIKKVEQLIKET